MSPYRGLLVEGREDDLDRIERGARAAHKAGLTDRWALDDVLVLVAEVRALRVALQCALTRPYENDDEPRK